MVRLYEVAKEAEEGDRIKWWAEKGHEGDRDPRIIRSVKTRGDKVEIEADGPQGGEAGFEVFEDGSSEAWFGPNRREMGAVKRVDLLDKEV